VYIPSHFDQPDIAAIHQLILAHPLGALVTVGASGLSANHVPFDLIAEPGPYGVLHGHLARANPVWKDLSGDAEVLVIFRGPNAYISPGWYPSKTRHGKVVPTWNYAVAHVYGRMRVVDDAAWVRSHVDRLTAREEAGFDRPWAVSDAPPDYTGKMLAAVIGIEIRLTRLEGKWKLSQNRPAEDREGVVVGLQGQGTGDAMALAGYVENAKE
jgi:transcriptional regulator